MNVVQPDCVTFAGSTQSSQDADLCAEAANNECEVGQATDSPCDICQAPGVGSPGLTLNLGFGFVSTGQSQDPDPCCDPDVPAECCCNDVPQDPDPDPPPPPGDPDNPGQPQNPPVNPPRMFGNTPQTCEVQCPDGTTWSATVPSGRIQAVSQALADAMAHSMACDEANQRKECHEGTNLCGCNTFCLDSPADYQVGTAPQEGEEKLFEIVEGDLPNGLQMSDSGQITGTPSDTLDSGTISVKITDSQGHTSVAAICLSVLGITTETLADGEVDVAYSAQLTAAGGHPPYTFHCDFGLPTGLSLNATTGQITGTPDTGGSYSPLFRVVDSCDANCPVQLEITINGTSITIPRVYCPTDPSIYVDVNTTVWGSTTADQDRLMQEAINTANQNASAALQALGCGCTVIPGTNLDTNDFTFKTSGCNITCLVYAATIGNPFVIDVGHLEGGAMGGPVATITNNYEFHRIYHCNFANDCLNPKKVCYVPQTSPQDTAHIIAAYIHTGHAPPFTC